MSNYRVTFTRLQLVFALCDYGEFDIARKICRASDDEVKEISCLAGEALLSGKFGRLLDKSIAAGGVHFSEGAARPLKRNRAKRLTPTKDAYLGNPLEEFLHGREDRFPEEIGVRILELYSLDPVMLRTHFDAAQYRDWELQIGLVDGCKSLDSAIHEARSAYGKHPELSLEADRDRRRFA